MQTESTGFASGLWLTVIGIFMGLGFAGGYLVASNHASTGLKKREAEWNSKSASYFAQENKLTAELAALKSTLSDRDKELATLRKKENDRHERGVVELFRKARQGFTYIKSQVDAGQFEGLDGTDGFQILSAAFEEEKK
ncbi:hypothetical protein [Roseimicrobium sp. ORNL1]|uniref:hypothetical protein n=1 Tax=Roseimicrobium sp. ORNL1 TaxID=2711231 RepID=UPI0013E17BC7|nr:hypothetical protein [Roseimicrobium sp. ORNL1]QIF01711.1 hypothetical protein G5S37_09300 [Roseimicrobium sp. ORNL1]